jgi:hypothetical protein
MASTWSSLGIRLMTTGENANAWGDQTNQNWERLEDAADGLATVAVTGATTLTFTPQPTSYADENGRNKVLVFTGTAGGTQAITFPNIEKTYHVLNDSNSTLTLTTGTGAATVSLEAGKDKMIYNDGSDEIHDAIANLAITSLDLSGNATVDGTALVTGVLTTTAATVFNGGFASNAASTITTADNTDTLTLTSTDADASVGPNLRLYRNSSSPADNDYNGAVQWEWRNDNSQDVIGAEIQSYTRDVTDGTEDNILWFQNMTQGTLTEFLRFDTQSDQAIITFNENSNDIDFRVESNGNANMLFVDGGNDHVNIGTSSDLGGTLNVQGAAVFSLTGNGDTLTLISTDEDAAQGPNLRLYRNSASPADNDVLGIIEFEGRNDNSQDFIAVQMESLVTDVSDGAEDAYLNISTMLAGSLRSRIEMDSGETVINEASQDLDFRVESNGNANMLFVDGGNDSVHIGSGTVESSDVLAVYGSGTSTPVRIVNTNANSVAPSLIFQKNSSSPADDDEIGLINFIGQDDAGGANVYSQIVCTARDVTNGTEDGDLQFGTVGAGSYAERMRIHSAGNVSIGTTDAHAKLTVMSASCGAGANGDADELQLEGSGNAGMTIASGSSSSGNIHFADVGAANRGILTYDHSADQMKFGTAGTIRARFTSAGDLLVAKSSSDYGTVGHELLAGGLAAHSRDQNPTLLLNRNTSEGTIQLFRYNNSDVGSISVTSSSTAFNTSSDYRLKENVSYDFDATSRLKQLKPSRFNFISDADKTVDGFLAHEVSDIVPEAITGEKDETETKEKVVLNANGNVIAEGIEEADWVTGKSDILWTSDDIETQDVLYTSDDVETQDVLYTEEDELPEGVEVGEVKESATKSVGDVKQEATQTVGDVKTEAIYPSDSTWEASKVIPVYQGIDQSKLVPLLVKTIQELEARITALES